MKKVLTVKDLLKPLGGSSGITITYPSDSKKKPVFYKDKDEYVFSDNFDKEKNLEVLHWFAKGPHHIELLVWEEKW